MKFERVKHIRFWMNQSSSIGGTAKILPQFCAQAQSKRLLEYIMGEKLIVNIFLTTDSIFILFKMGFDIKLC